VRIVSLLPAATEIVLALGLGEELVGVTELCDVPAALAGVAVVARRPRAAPASPGGASTGPAVPLLWVTAAALVEADPDLVIGSDVCRVCSAGSRELRAMAADIDDEVEVLSLDPVSVEGVLNAIQAVGAMTEAEDAAMDIVVGLRERLQAVEVIVVGRRDHGFVPPRVAALEWLDPPTAVGRWIPEQVRLAGGWELLGGEGERAALTSWEAVREVDPEILVLMPSNLHLDETVAAWAAMPRPEGWEDLRAVRDGRVFAVDGAGHFARPGPRIVDGIEALAEIIDPLAFDGMSLPGSWARVG
jgi:iron complex transport system substrate-binding protein